MITNILNELYTDLKSSLQNVNVYMAEQNYKAEFPCVVISETSNSEYAGTRDNNGNNFLQMGIELNIYSTSKNYRTEIYNIRTKIDEKFSDEYRFEKTDDTMVLNYSDTNVSRHVMRYSFVIDKNDTIYKI